MAQAIVRGVVRARVLAPAQIVVCEPDEAKRAIFRELGIHATDSHAEALDDLGREGMILLAVKPQVFATLATQMNPQTGAAWLVVSIMAGVRVQAIREALGWPGRPVVRTMPNLAASVGLGITAIASDSMGVGPNDLARVESIFSSVGKLVRTPEDQLDAFTALAGSGPAYVYYLAEAMTDAALRCGFTREDAELIVRQTLLGSATQLAQASESARELRGAVTSKGGTTEAAIAAMDRHQVLNVIADAILAGRDRARELGK